MLKRSFLMLGIVILLGGCARNSAFEYFTKLDSTQERAVTNLRKMTIREHNETRTLISVIYLNPVQPELYRHQHFFLISIYDVESASLQDFSVRLNGEEPVGTALLDDNCTLKALMPLNNTWNTYYEVVFKESEEENLTLTFENGPSSKGAVTYRTGQ